jgi:hypothetical protein
MKSVGQAPTTSHEAQFGHGSIKLGKMDLNPSRDKIDHNLAGSTSTIDPIYQSPPESDSKGDRKVYMVGQGEELPEKTTEEIAREAEEEIALAARLAKEADKGKMHNDL